MDPNNDSDIMKVGLRDLLTSEVLGEMMSRYGMDPTTLKEIDTYENFIFEAMKQKDEFIIRISHSSYRVKDQIEAEIDWINFLEKEGMPVAIPVLSLNEEYVEEITVDDFSFLVTVFVKAPGQTIADNPSLLTIPIIEKWGSILGKFHNLTRKYKSRSPQKRRDWIQENELSRIDDILSDYPKILAMAKKHIAYITNLPKNNDTYGLIHYDLHEINILVDQENITVIDFDDCQYDYFVSDFASIFFQLAWRFHNKERSREEVIKDFYPTFMKGYFSEFSLPEFWISKIPEFLKLRHIALFCTLIVEDRIESTLWGRQVIEWWIPMLENDEPWINFNLKL